LMIPYQPFLHQWNLFSSLHLQLEL